MTSTSQENEQHHLGGFSKEVVEDVESGGRSGH